MEMVITKYLSVAISTTKEILLLKRRPSVKKRNYPCIAVNRKKFKGVGLSYSGTR